MSDPLLVDWQALSGAAQEQLGPCAATIGTFDGIHLGHRAILSAVAAAPGANAVVTFVRHPRAVLTGVEPGVLTTMAQRQARFAALGVHYVVLIDFSREFSNLTGQEFVSALQGRLSLTTLVVGVDFRCGRNRDTDVVGLKRLLAPRVPVMAMQPVVYGSAVVSSTRIRHAIRTGDVELAATLMDAPYEIDLRNVAPAWVPGRTQTIAEEQLGQILPGPGRYDATVVTAKDSMPVIAHIADGAVHIEAAGGGEASWTGGQPIAGLRFVRRAGEDTAVVDATKEQQTTGHGAAGSPAEQAAGAARAVTDR